MDQSGGDVFMVPRINIHPGATQEWIEKCNYKVNEVGWNKWPDYNWLNVDIQLRVILASPLVFRRQSEVGKRGWINGVRAKCP